MKVFGVKLGIAPSDLHVHHRPRDFPVRKLSARFIRDAYALPVERSFTLYHPQQPVFKSPSMLQYRLLHFAL